VVVVDYSCPQKTGDWVGQHGWITSALYVPDYDPASSIFASELEEGRDAIERIGAFVKRHVG